MLPLQRYYTTLLWFYSTLSYCTL